MRRAALIGKNRRGFAAKTERIEKHKIENKNNKLLYKQFYNSKRMKIPLSLT